MTASFMLARSLAGGGRYDHAEQVAGKIARPEVRAAALTAVAAALAEAGQTRRARDAARRAASVARTAYVPFDRARGLVLLAGASSPMLRCWPARSPTSSDRFWLDRMMADPVRADAMSPNVDTAGEGEAVQFTIGALLGEGQIDRAVEIADQVREPYWRGRTLVNLARQLVETGEYQ